MWTSRHWRNGPIRNDPSRSSHNGNGSSLNAVTPKDPTGDGLTPRYLHPNRRNHNDLTESGINPRSLNPSSAALKSTAPNDPSTNGMHPRNMAWTSLDPKSLPSTSTTFGNVIPNGLDSNDNNTYVVHSQQGHSSRDYPRGTQPLDHDTPADALELLSQESQPNGYDISPITLTNRCSSNGLEAHHRPNGVSAQHQVNETMPHVRGPLLLQPTPLTEDDRPIGAVRLPADGSDAHWVHLDFRYWEPEHSRFPDFQRWLGRHEPSQIDTQMFRVLWEEMEVLNGTYVLFSWKLSEVAGHEKRWNEHFKHEFRDDVFLLKIKEAMDKRSCSADPLGHAIKTVPWYAGLKMAPFEKVPIAFFNSSLYYELRIAALPFHRRVAVPASIDIPIPLGFWRAWAEGRLRLEDYQVLPVTAEMDSVIKFFWPAYVPLPPALLT